MKVKQNRKTQSRVLFLGILLLLLSASLAPQAEGQSSNRQDQTVRGPIAPAPSADTVRVAIANMRLDEPNEVDPVSVGAVAVGHAISGAGKTGRDKGASEKSGVYTVENGALVTLVVRLKIADGWHTYADVGEQPYKKVTKINIELPKSARWEGEWQTPRTYPSVEPGLAEYRGDAVFTRQFYFISVPTEDRNVSTGQAQVSLLGTVRYQACSGELCLLPRNIPFEASIIVVN